MDVLLLIVGIILLIAGLVGCIVPMIPGPPLGFLALLALHFTKWGDFSAGFLWGAAAAALIVTLLDYLVPVWGTKRFGGSKAGVWGASIGLVVGMFLGPAGIILGPFVGAFIGEMATNNESSRALKAAFGSFIGLIVGVVLKLAVCGVYTWYFFKEWLF
ncbi:MAG: DUF456 domain-containing protein [Bacteroidales bacterium]|jgi:uncharacterized protein YqgC (DUF456 family)|nr:DUF456 domain-containing protein [Bacteroidales bacterium]